MFAAAIDGRTPSGDDNPGPARGTSLVQNICLIYHFCRGQKDSGNGGRQSASSDPGQAVEHDPNLSAVSGKQCRMMYVRLLCATTKVSRVQAQGAGHWDDQIHGGDEAPEYSQHHLLLPCQMRSTLLYSLVREEYMQVLHLSMRQT